MITMNKSQFLQRMVWLETHKLQWLYEYKFRFLTVYALPTSPDFI